MQNELFFPAIVSRKIVNSMNGRITNEKLG